MKILITGAAGFVGSRLAEAIAHSIENIELIGIDNLSRRGSETNLAFLSKLGCKLIHGDIRVNDDVVELPKVDWILDCAAIPSVMAGIGGGSAQLVGHNLIGTLNLLEKCRRDRCGFLMLSTSRVYAINSLLEIKLVDNGDRFTPDLSQPLPNGFSKLGVNESFSTTAPISLYGATKLASEVMALEYAATFEFPLWINRCGVIAGAGQFGKPDQGIFSFWIYQWLCQKPLKYIGFGGEGKQVRDFVCPQDLARLIQMQLNQPDRQAPKIVNVGGGNDCAMSLKELSAYCRANLGDDCAVASVPETRTFDIPYYVTDNSLVKRSWGWQPEVKMTDTLAAIANWAKANQPLIESGF
ncbi:NAD-dependent epimerase/dehydratase [Thalassoporum mexicanum PCC 7367]|uniref:NAD-dependent epimerase/dehydratase family protein n=1 Tax=Thalassoporum mexicanum TaxID=3457544 RepID=UPI00029F8367|nr:NAD-dependent epimerase/dehydratase family protein [Pseudanabaena sp. PCC 7367]AFY71852.1 NAD-dependent epimerase/dehydratase [Pseudanabaena sp. PCC 7367]